DQRLERRQFQLEAQPVGLVPGGEVGGPGGPGPGVEVAPDLVVRPGHRRVRPCGTVRVSEPAATALVATASRSPIESASAPGPTNSSTAFVPPPTPISPMTARITSFPVTNAPVLPVTATWIVSGTACQNDPSARHEAMSCEPSPMPH